jgi:integrase
MAQNSCLLCNPLNAERSQYGQRSRSVSKGRFVNSLLAGLSCRNLRRSFNQEREHPVRDHFVVFTNSGYSPFNLLFRFLPALFLKPHHDTALLGHAFQLAVKEWEWVAENPVHKISKEKVRNLLERWLTPEEEARLLAASPGWLQEIVVFAINTGFRQSEILNLQWGQVDLFRRTITLLEQKNGGRDTLPVNAKTLGVLKARAKVRSLTTDYVFSNGAGNRRDARDLLRVFYPAMKQADVRRFRFHDLRHTFATRLVQAGADIYTVQKLGRWKTISMVQRYAHHHAESLRAGIEMLDRVPAAMSTI